jgi:hypothetical protein
MVLTMAAVAEHKGIAVTRLMATVDAHADLTARPATTHLTSYLDLGEGLTLREQHILYNSARNCEVHKMLRGKVVFEEHLL